MRLRQAAKRDGNHAAIVAALRARGAIVVDLAQLGRGIPDALVGYKGLTVLLEIKLPQSAFMRGGVGGKTARDVAAMDPQHDFTPAEVKFHREWNGQPIITVRSEVEALAAVGL